MTAPRIAVAALAAVAWAVTATAQDLPRVTLTINGLARAPLTAFTEVLAFREVTADEDTTFVATYAPPGGPEFEVGGAVRVKGRLGVGVSVSYFHRRHGGTYDLGVPHPLFLDSARTVTGRVDGLERRELAVHLLAVYTIPVGDRVRVNLQGGPSVFRARQAIIQGVTIDEFPPFDEVVLQDVSQSTHEVTRLGFSAGLDATWVIGGPVGVGALLRYAWASAELTPMGTVVENRRIDLSLGGLQLGGGIRLGF